jgi:adenosylmethionine-8-amino-7-oxononanoate aminotransferase
MADSNADELTLLAFEHCIFPLAETRSVHEEGPRIYVRGEGVRLTDIHGVTRLDMMSSHTRANSLGYGNREIAEAVFDQMARLHYVGTTSHLAEPTIRLAARIAGHAPGRLSRVAFTSGGSESVETALKLAKQYQKESGRKPRAYKTISRWTAYHGSTMGALSVTDWLAVREVFEPRVPGHSFVANPTRYRNPFGMSDDDYADLCATMLERQIELEGPETVAAFIGEPVMQAHGVQMPPQHYWDRVRAICDKHGVVMIVDEVITGFGRTGAWFASEHFGIEPDIMTMAKALSGGYAPIGAVITRDEIADAVPLFRHVHTFAGHASAAAAANAAIGIKERDGLIEKGRTNGARFGAELKAALAGHPIVGDVRGIGMWHCVDFTADRKTRAPFADDTVQAVVRRMHDHGVIASAIGTALEMAPPLISEPADLDEAVAVCARSVAEVARERGLA